MTKVVLTVDDSASVRNIIQMSLTGAGYEVVTACDGAEALKKLDAINVDLIISDVNMPNMDGLTFIKAVRERPTTKFTPILMLTTESGKEEVMQAKQAGAKAWMLKPFKGGDVVDTVQKLLPLK